MDSLQDLSQHIVEINKLNRDLNELIRKTYKPDLDEIEIVCQNIEHHARMCLALVDWERVK
jgi:hypothetical protein